MWKSCSKCGKVHDVKYKCNVRATKPVPTEDRRLRSQSAWTNKSIEIRERSNYLCQVCLDQGKYTYDGLEVHHIEKLKDNPNKLLDDLNLICLCKHHHELADAGKIDHEYLRKLAKKIFEKK